MADCKFEKKVDKWLTGDISRRERVFRYFKVFYYNRCAGLLSRIRFWGVVNWLVKTTVIASAPMVAWFYDDAISLAKAVVVSLGLFLAHGFVNLLDKLSLQKSGDASGAETELVTRFGEVIDAYDENSTRQEDKDISIVASLGIIEILAGVVTKTRKGEVAVSLATYTGPGQERMRIRHRNPGNTRPLNKEFQGNDFLGHRACQAGTDPRVVNDLKDFGQTGLVSPTQSSVNYRSIFIIPLGVENGQGQETVLGFLSIDCTRPYAFFGERQNAIMVDIEPVVRHIKQLISREGRQ